MYMTDDLHRVLLDLKPRVYVVATGAGAGIQQTLWEKPGASKYLVGAAFPYDNPDTRDWLGFQPGKSVSRRTAIQLAQEAFMRACRGCQDGPPIGLGVTAAVMTDRERLGENKVCIAVVSELGSSVYEEVFRKQDQDLADAYRAIHGRWVDQAACTILAKTIGLNWALEGKLEELSDEESKEVIYERPVFYPYGRRGSFSKSFCVFFPGSFNPIHDGHRGIIKHASENCWGKIAYTLTSDSIHKPSLTAVEILKRASQFRNEDYPLIVTKDDALYILKARQFPCSVFVMGVDTLIRVLEPKWFAGIVPEYENKGIIGIHEMLAEFRRLGTKFEVFDRTIDGKLVTLDDVSISAEYRDLFRRIPLHWDISSTELRKRVKVVS